MRYIIKNIIELIKNNVPSENVEMMIRIDGFEDIKIYETLARSLKNEFFNKNLRIDIKLAKNKWKYFLKNSNETTVIQSLKQNGWVAEDESITFYRNLHKSNILILMGTEDEEDKGGLLNCYTITPDTLIKSLHSEYHKIFEDDSGFLSSSDLKLIDKLYKDLFEFVPIDICKLSDLADKYEGRISNINDFIELFYETLSCWGLPYKKLELPTLKELERDKNILRLEYNFISRQMFKKMSNTQYNKYLMQIDYYNSQSEKYCETWNGWNNQNKNISTYDEFSKILKEYIRGEDIITNKQKLLSIDFSIIEDVLDIKLPKKKSRPKKATPTLTGEPLEAFTEALLEILTTIRSEDKVSITNLTFEITQADIVSMYSNVDYDEEKKELINAWNTICRHTNGVIEYLDKAAWKIDKTKIVLNCLPENIFSPENTIKYIDEGIVKAASANKTITKINLVVHCFNSDNVEEKSLKQEFQWKFEMTSSWLHNFYDLCSQNVGEIYDDSYIPIATISNFNSLLFAKSEKEFFDLYDESDLKFNFNIIEYVDKKSNNNAKEYLVRFYKLGKSFKKFIQTINNKGLYYCIGKDSSELSNLVYDYTNLGNYITSKTMPENLEWLLNVYIHAFNIELDSDVIESDRDINSCIVPPWHPATLERLNDQKIFFLSGCKEWWNAEQLKKGNSINRNEIRNMINDIREISKIKNPLDIFPSSGQQYFGAINSFGLFSLYGRNDIENTNRLKDMIHKDAIFDDDFNDKEIAEMNDNARMIFEVIENYSKAFPNSYSNLNVVFIDPSELQPIIAALYKYIEIVREKHNNVIINIMLKILVKPENKGGRNYLEYWMDQFFSQDANVNIRTYLNEWSTKGDLDKLLDGNNDIIFVMDLLKINNLQFIKENKSVDFKMNQCRFPIVYKPSPISATTVKRKIELSQPQFKASFTHTQVVRFKNNLDTKPEDKYIVVREVCIDDEVQELVYSLHEKAYWVVCIDSGMDGALLRNDKIHKDEYSIIGFSTGKGAYGQYNLTITTRKTILDAIKNKFQIRLHQLFHWEKDILNEAAQICLTEASGLDGISLFSAINQKDNNIREFMAYVLTSLRESSKSEQSVLKIIVHLDSYKHWFNSELIDSDKENKSSSRPDFLILEVVGSDNDKIKLKATVVECKISSYKNSDKHKEKAFQQVNHGIERLSTIFNPASTSIKRRYWYAQLYRALAFAQVTFSNNTMEFEVLSAKLRSILEGNFEIEWYGEVLGYWLDMGGNNEILCDTCKSNIKIYNIPQLCIQRLLLHSDVHKMKYINIEDSTLLDEENQEDTINQIEKEIEDEMEKIQNNTIDFENINKEFESEDNKKNWITNNYDNDSDGENDFGREINQEVDSKLEDIRVLIGKDRKLEKVYWEFGNNQLANRHMLITGTSGQGKTYAIQTMLYELSKKNISSIIFDYTEGFRIDQLENEFVQKMGNKIVQNIIKFDGVPINPFKRHEIEITGKKILEPAADVAARLANILVHVYGFGDQQFSAIFEATRRGIEKYDTDMDMTHFREELELLKSENSSAKTVLSKMAPFFYSIKFNKNTDFDWNNILYASIAQINIFQLTSIDREMQVIITELMLWDAWYFTKKFGKKDKPFVVILDEAQNLSHKEKSPSAAILTEGRKFGWSAWFATQSLKVLSDDEVVRLMQSAFKLYFKPTDDEIPKVAKQLDPSDSNIWISTLKNLKKGQCIVVGQRIKNDRQFGIVKPTITNISAFKERN